MRRPITQQVRPTFPVFVVARSVDAEYAEAASAMPEGTPISTVSLPFQGTDQACLAWFTDEEHARRFMRASNLHGCTVAITSPTEAVQFLERREFFGVALNPRGVGHTPTVYLYADFVGLFRRLADGADNGA